MKVTRFQWAEEYKKYTFEDWGKIIYSNESRLKVLTKRSQFVRQRPSERYKEASAIKSMKHLPSLMVWSCITTEGTGPLYFVNGAMEQKQYKKAIQNYLVPYIGS